MKRLLIAGPCAAESREQVLTTARQIQAAVGGCVFRAGVWKPRTSPASFQGAGEEALEWLREVKAETGMPLATEVATAEHIRLALEAGVEYLWIGARTSASPIVVENLAEALTRYRQGADGACAVLPKVLIKNPVNPDARLWIGNIARLERSGLPVMAVHRGCAHRPSWRMAYRLRQERPEIPILLDPSHLTGERALVARAMEKIDVLGFDGAMIEVHCNPETALSDARQQITPAELGELLKTKMVAEPLDRCDDLAWLRAMIDEVDDDLWAKIEERMNLAEEIGGYKKKHLIPPLQQKRFEAILAQRLEWSKTHRISEDAVRGIMNALHQEALRRQQ